MDNESIEAAARDIIAKVRGPHSLDFKVSERMELETEVAAIIRSYARGDTPYAPTAQQVWQHTEDRARVLAEQAAKADKLSDILMFVCDCQAATAYDYLRKSAGKNDIRRHRNICKDVADMLESGEFFGHIRSDKQTVIKRLRDAAALLEE